MIVFHISKACLYFHYIHRNRNPLLAEDTYRDNEQRDSLIRADHRPYIPFVQTYIFPKPPKKLVETKPTTPVPIIADKLLDQLDYRLLLEKKRLIKYDMQQLEVS